MEAAAFFFAFSGHPADCRRYGSGHINETYLVETDTKARYILQRINHHVFRDIPGLMRNIQAVTDHLWKKDQDARRIMALVPTKDGASFFMDGAGEFWRAFRYIEGSVSLERAASAGEFYQSGVAVGRFQSNLSDFPAETLCETIPGFHDTIRRYARFEEVLRADPLSRVREVGPEIDFALQRAGEAGAMMRMLRAGELPLRVTHNDTKLNNVLLDELTGEPLCLVDLDTVMPGLCGNDFGDAIRSGASTAAEDEQDLRLVSLSLPLYEAFSRGFLSSCGRLLTDRERETLPLAARLITLECGLRFLTDYLEGDVYFHIHRPGHNLDRCRNQFALVLDMEQKSADMQRIVADCPVD